MPKSGPAGAPGDPKADALYVAARRRILDGMEGLTYTDGMALLFECAAVLCANGASSRAEAERGAAKFARWTAERLRPIAGDYFDRRMAAAARSAEGRTRQ